MYECRSMKIFCADLAVFLLASLLIRSTLSVKLDRHSSPLRYSSTLLKALMSPCLARSSAVYGINNDNNNNNRQTEQEKPRRRSWQGEVEARLRHSPSKSCPPTVVLRNTHSLNNRNSGINENVRFLPQYRKASVICFSENWLTSEVTKTFAPVHCFNFYQLDKDLATTQKEQRGDICDYRNDQWCHGNEVHAIHRACTPDIEIVTLTIRPFYLPREIHFVTQRIFYIPPGANETKYANNALTDLVCDQQTRSPDFAIFVACGCNKCKSDPVFFNFYQYVDVPLRKMKTLDLFYVNIPNAYKCTAAPPSDRSDHDLLLPEYRIYFKGQKIMKKVVTIWNKALTRILQGCLDCTNWDVF